MNFIKINQNNSVIEQTDSKKETFSVAEFRKYDYEKFEKILYNMWENLAKLHPDYSYEIKKQKLVSAYSGFGRDHQMQFIIWHKFKDVESELRINLPELVYDSYFILSNSYYIPTMVLERLPIDKNVRKQVVFVLLSNKHVFAITKSKKSKADTYIVTTSRNKVVLLDYFVSALFVNKPEYLEELRERKIIKKIYNYNKAIKDVINALGFFNPEYFKSEILLPDFMNNYYALPYHRELWKRIYGVDKFEDLFFLAIKAYHDEKKDREYFDLSDLRNRRLVMSEYLISSVYDTHYRTLNTLTDKEGAKKIILPTMKANAIISVGFRNLLHGKQIYDISSPWAIPLMYKVSQKISIIQNEVPKSWAQLHDTHYGIVDPINISPSDFGSVITFTSESRVDKYGMFEVPNNGVKTFDFPEENYLKG